MSAMNFQVEEQTLCANGTKEALGSGFLHPNLLVK